MNPELYNYYATSLFYGSTIVCLARKLLYLCAIHCYRGSPISAGLMRGHWKILNAQIKRGLMLHIPPFTFFNYIVFLHPPTHTCLIFLFFLWLPFSSLFFFSFSPIFVEYLVAEFLLLLLVYLSLGNLKWFLGFPSNIVIELWRVVLATKFCRELMHVTSYVSISKIKTKWIVWSTETWGCQIAKSIKLEGHGYVRLRFNSCPLHWFRPSFLPSQFSKKSMETWFQAKSIEV